MRKRYYFLSIVFFVSALSLLYYKSRVSDHAKAESIYTSFRNIKQADSLLDENILKSRYYLNKNYDPINESLQIIQSEINFLDKGEHSLRKTESAVLIKKLEEYINVFNEKKTLIDGFKAHNAILKNALYLLPISVTKVKEQKLYDGSYLDESLKNILIFNLTGDQNQKLVCENNLNRLKASQSKVKNIEFEILIKHIENILQKKITLDNLLNDILKIRTAESLEILSVEYALFYNSFLINANIYRLLTYAFSVLLIIYIVFILVKLMISSISIKIANDNLISLNKTFEKFVPKESIALLSKSSLKDLRLGDNVKKKMTVLFSDIRSFTTLSEKMTPEESFGFINSYLGVMGPVIRKNNGFIDKYIGDAIMAIFENEASAVQAGIEMLQCLKEYNKRNRNSEERPPIKIGIGIHAGDMMFGTVGEYHRMDSTVISDAVNLSSRIESISKHYGSPFLISEDIYEAIKDDKSLKVRYIDRITVKGKNIPVAIYEIYNSDPEPLIAKKDNSKEAYQKALDLFYERNFVESNKFVSNVLTEFPTDKPTLILIERIQQWSLKPKELKVKPSLEFETK